LRGIPHIRNPPITAATRRSYNTWPTRAAAATAITTIIISSSAATATAEGFQYHYRASGYRRIVAYVSISAIGTTPTGTTICSRAYYHG
jgi:predicted amidohydrolase